MEGAPAGTLVRKLARAWYRGPARHENGLIVLDGPQVVPYEPMLEHGIGIELARVRTPAEAVSFATRFGLLGTRAMVWTGESQEPSDRLAAFPAGARIDEPFSAFEQAAERLRRILTTLVDVRRAAQGDATARRRLRADFGGTAPDAELTYETREGFQTVKARDVLPPDDLAPKNDRAVLVNAAHWAAWGLDEGLMQASAEPYVFEPAQLFPDGGCEPGHPRIGVLPRTLLGFCYLAVAQGSAKETLATCSECQRVFIVEDARQKFCNPACGSRARFRRWKEVHRRGGR